jgi:ATP-dependent helicase HrpB
MAARRVASEHREPLGQRVGYQVRFDECASRDTRLRFVTEGVLTRRILADPSLSGIGAVVLDEFHERHLQADLAIALLKRLQHEARQDLKIVVMSATLDTSTVARFLDDCPFVRSAGRSYEVEVEYLQHHDSRPLEEQVSAAVGRRASSGLDGDILVFLPGAAEIRKAQTGCAKVSSEFGLVILPLHGELPAEEQDRAVAPASQRKVILSTNVAESSITIEGVTTVIDSGLVRIASHSPWTGLPTLTTGRISRASAIQRAGRAGRIGPGRAVRLYTESDYEARPDHQAAEIHRADLADAALEIHAAGIARLGDFNWFEVPPVDSLSAAEMLLQRLGAIDARGSLTEIGRRMVELPVHPRLARILIATETREVAAEGCVAVALLGERDIRSRRIFDGRGEREGASHHSSSDLLHLFDLFDEARTMRFDSGRLRNIGLDPAKVRNVDRVAGQLQRAMKAGKARAGSELTTRDENALLISILAGFPDRVARSRQREPGKLTSEISLNLSDGTVASLAPESVVRNAEFLIAAQAEERLGRGRSARGGVHVTLASTIEPEWLLDLFPDRIQESTETFWDEQALRVVVAERLSYDQLVLDESTRQGVANPATAAILAKAVRDEGAERFYDPGEMEELVARIDFVRRAFPEAAIPTIDSEAVEGALVSLTEGRSSFSEVRDAVRAGELTEVIMKGLTQDQRRLLAQMAPLRLQLPSGRQARVGYQVGQTPFISSRIQDFFGLREAPRIAGGRVSPVLHLLAPNQRPVQVTQDLAGFWQRNYPQLRKELGRRYPRHSWPEDPLSRPE